MAKKDWTPEERAAFGAKMRAAKAAKSQTNTPKTTEPTVVPDEVYQEAANVAPVEHNPTVQDQGDLQRQLDEMKAYMFDFMKAKGGEPALGAPTVTNRGVIGTLEKYLLDPANYPDPRERLAKEPRLQRFAFPLNFELSWKVGVTQYDTKEGIHVKEPNFQLELWKIIMDEETGEPTAGRYVLTKALFHEDPTAALAVAEQNGINPEDLDEKTFLNEMRYLMFRDWLFEAFYTPLPARSTSNKKEMAVGGKIMTYFEVNSEEAKGIDFSKLTEDATRF